MKLKAVHGGRVSCEFVGMKHGSWYWVTGDPELSLHFPTSQGIVFLFVLFWIGVGKV